MNPLRSLIQNRPGPTLGPVFGEHRSQPSGLAWPTDDLISALGGSPTLAGEKIDTTTAMRISDVFTAVNIIAEEIGGLPLKVFRQVGDATLEATDHRAYRMLHDAPNPSMPALRFWSTLAAHLLLWGNAYIEKLRDANGLVSELWIIHPSWVTVQWSWQARQKRFLINWPQSGESEPLDESRILHIFGVSTDGLIGLSPIGQCRDTLGVSMARTRFEADVYDKKPFLTGVIQHPGTIKDATKMRESWQAIYAGQGESRHGTPVLEEGAVFNQSAMPLADMEFVASAQLSKTDIANIFKLPPWELGGSVGNSLTYQTVEGNKVQYATRAIAPVTTCIAKFLAADAGIFPFSSWYPEFVLAGLLRGDSNARADYYTKLSAVKAITSDEIRELENMPPLTPSQKDSMLTAPAGAGSTPAGTPPAPAPAQDGPPAAAVASGLQQVP